MVVYSVFVTRVREADSGICKVGTGDGPVGSELFMLEEEIAGTPDGSDTVGDVA
jgi:hypothetical protein